MILRQFGRSLVKEALSATRMAAILAAEHH
jgi:hypothetical protein